MIGSKQNESETPDWLDKWPGIYILGVAYLWTRRKINIVKVEKDKMETNGLEIIPEILIVSYYLARYNLKFYIKLR